MFWWEFSNELFRRRRKSALKRFYKSSRLQDVTAQREGFERVGLLTEVRRESKQPTLIFTSRVISFAESDIQTLLPPSRTGHFDLKDSFQLHLTEN